MIPLSKIVADVNQPRKIFAVKDLETLMTSIKKEGVMSPLLVESNFEGGKFLLLDGERRFRAATALKLATVPCIVETGPLSFERRTQLRFNIQEQHATWNDIDKAKAIFEYKRATGQTIQEIAEKLNMHLPKVHTYLSITKFSEAAQNLIAEKNIQFSYLTYLARIVESYLLLSNKLEREDVETKIIEKISAGVFKTIPDIQNFSKTLQSMNDIETKLAFLNEDMTFFEYMESLKLDTKDYVAKVRKILQNLNFELARGKEKGYRLFDDQFALFGEIVNKMSEFESIQAIEENKDDTFDGL